MKQEAACRLAPPHVALPTSESEDLRAGRSREARFPEEHSRSAADHSSRAVRQPASTLKRLFDLTVASACVVFMLPSFALVACWIKLVSNGPVFFRQERIGYRGQRFTMWKFRSMEQNAETVCHENHVKQLMASNRPLTKLDAMGDSRLIRGGRLLRASCLDELPQLFNVIRGEMSLVGPRPCTPVEFSYFSPFQRRRCDAKPGLTGFWQVHGKNKTTFRKMIAMDILYTKRMSLWLDLWILVRTIPAIIVQIVEARLAQRKRAFSS